MEFKELNIIDPILKAIEHEGYEKPSPIQAETIPVLLEGKDLLGCAQTGTGKTAAFAIPILQTLYMRRQNNADSRKLQALILLPRENLRCRFVKALRHTDVIPDLGWQLFSAGDHKNRRLLSF